MAKQLLGKEVTAALNERIKADVAALNAKGVKPTLGIIRVGERPDDLSYERGATKRCETLGVACTKILLPADATQEQVLAAVEQVNKDDKIHGVLLFRPLPKHLNQTEIENALDPAKDVDGFHPQSVGALCIGQPGFVSCTPAGIIQLLKRSGVEIEGKECVILGRSNIVGKPMALLMLRENATVTIAHSRTKNLKEVTGRADILIAAVGKPKMVTRDYVKKGAVVIDVGINRDENNKLCGDVDFADVEPVCSAITPVPGGVGPMTIAMLLNNCIESAGL